MTYPADGANSLLIAYKAVSANLAGVHNRYTGSTESDVVGKVDASWVAWEKLSERRALGVPTQHYNEGEFSVLHCAASSGQDSLVKQLLELDEPVDIQARDKRGYTPLHLAAWNGHTSTVEILLSKGAYIESTDNRGLTPLHIATGSRQDVVIKQLVDRKANVNVQASNGWTALHIAAKCGYDNIVKSLLRYNADANAWNNNGDTALDYAMEGGYDAITALLIEWQTKSLDNPSCLAEESSDDGCAMNPISTTTTSINYALNSLSVGQPVDSSVQVVSGQPDILALDIPALAYNKENKPPSYEAFKASVRSLRYLPRYIKHDTQSTQLSAYHSAHPYSRTQGLIEALKVSLDNFDFSSSLETFESQLSQLLELKKASTASTAYAQIQEDIETFLEETLIRLLTLPNPLSHTLLANKLVDYISRHFSEVISHKSKYWLHRAVVFDSLLSTEKESTVGVLGILLEYGNIDLFCADMQNNTVLDYAVALGNAVATQKILSKAASLPPYPSEDGSPGTALSYQKSYALVNRRNHSGETVLHMAVRDNRIDIVRQLIDAGARTDERSIQNKTPMQLAQELQLEALVICLDAAARSESPHKDFSNDQALKNLLGDDLMAFCMGQGFV